jgi:putative nucleotidyltransferase with HDIG domain
MMAAVPHENQNEAVRAILSKVSEIAVLPQVVYRIIELTGNTGTAVHEIESAISIDPGFSSKVLMLANSAYYALPRKMTSIREATTFLGFKTIRQLAMTVGIFDMFVGKTDAGSLRRRAWWRHSVDAAVCAQAIAKVVRTVAPDEAYSCGLLHDVGKPLLDRYGSGDYAEAEKLEQSGSNILIAERVVFGCTHVEVGAAAAAAWKFPQPLYECVAFHHAPPEGEIPLHVAVTCFADEVAHALVSGHRGTDSDERTIGGFSRWAVEALAFGPDKIEEALAACKEAVANGSSRAA